MQELKGSHLFGRVAKFKIFPIGYISLLISSFLRITKLKHSIIVIFTNLLSSWKSPSSSDDQQRKIFL